MSYITREELLRAIRAGCTHALGRPTGGLLWGALAAIAKTIEVSARDESAPPTREHLREPTPEPASEPESEMPSREDWTGLASVDNIKLDADLLLKRQWRTRFRAFARLMADGKLVAVPYLRRGESNP